MYDIKFEKTVLNFLEKLEKEIVERILKKIEFLKKDPIPKDAKRIINLKDKVFRIRIGKYRILYRIEKDFIVIIRIDKRSRVYKNLIISF
jgi:mRNA interferase RelE/StbE